MSMAERRLFTVIKNGLQVFIDDPLKYEALLRTELELEEPEIAKALLYFRGGTNVDGDAVNARPPTLVHGYARTGGPFPCWALTLGAESISQDYLGKDAPYLDSDGENFFDPDTNQVVDPHVRRMQYRFDIYVYADHPDITQYYYQLLKRVVMSNQDALEDEGVEDMGFTGADLAPDPRYLPSDVFGRQLQLTVFGDECWTKSVPRGTSVSGIAVDDTGNGVTSGVGSVDANVTPYAVGS